MRVLARRHAICGALVLGLAAGSAPLFADGALAAMDAKKVADHLVAAVAEGGKVKGSYAKAVSSGKDVTISGLKLVNEKNGTIDVPSLVLINPTERKEGGFTAEKATFAKAKIVDEDTTVTIAAASIDKLTVPSIEEAKERKRFVPFEKLSISGIAITGDNPKAPVEVASLSMTFGDIADGVPHSVKFDMQGIAVPTAAFDDPGMKERLDQLGYKDGFVGALAMDSAYAPDTDTMTLRSLTLSAEKVGKLTIATTITGVPMSKLAASMDASAVLATGKLTIASVRFDNAGVIERVLDAQAKSMGIDRKTFVEQTSAAMPFMLTQAIDSAAFRQKVATAVAAFLKDPKSLLVVAAPSNPIPFMDIVGALSSKPQSLPEVLVLDVSANK